jgi:hypothetical protein
MRLVPGVGEKRLRDFGSLFLTLIADHCRAHGSAFDVPPMGRKA